MKTKAIINCDKGSKRASIVIALCCVVVNFVYATQEGLRWSWTYLSNGWFIQRHIAISMVKLRLGELSNFFFVLIHSLIIFLITWGFLKILTLAIKWVYLGFKRERK